MTKQDALAIYRDNSLAETRVMYYFTITATAGRGVKNEYVYRIELDLADLADLLYADRDADGAPTFRVKCKDNKARCALEARGAEYIGKAETVFADCANDGDNRGARGEDITENLAKRDGKTVIRTAKGLPFYEGPDMWIDGKPIQVKVETATLAAVSTLKKLAAR